MTAPVIGDPSLTPPAPDGRDIEIDDSVLARAAGVRFPNLRELTPVERISALVDHIADTAILRGELEELRLNAHVKLLEVRDRLDQMPSAGRNRASIDEAKRAAAPELAREQDHGKWLVARCTEQINRLDRDYDAASRAYTLIAGT